MTSLQSLAQEDYVSLTTFKRDGTGVATPVWVTRDGDHLLVMTEGTSGKAKRLRNISRVMVAPCDMRGRVTGAWVDGTAELVEDAAGTAHVVDLITAKYGWQARVTAGLETVRAGVARVLRRPRTSSRVGIRITLAH